ncbi:MAG: hypothetical protein CL676_13620 [Bdellovibrionaceae bacterium]|nr:hypothetical protein [Pseudobdellovibrionaceae bacterium]
MFEAKGADELKALGWLKFETFFLLSFLLSSSCWALNFDKEIHRREVVSVRLAEDMSEKMSQGRGPQGAGHALKNSKKRQGRSVTAPKTSSRSSFSVQLKPISR